MSYHPIRHRLALEGSKGLAAGQEDDRQWFRFNPTAKWRLRRALPGEALALCRRVWALALQAGEPPPKILIAPEHATHVLVTQIRPGVRTRDACRPPAPGAERDAWVAATAAEVLGKAPAVAAFYASLSEEALAEALAWATLPPDALDLSRSMEADLRSKGKALREARGHTRQ